VYPDDQDLPVVRVRVARNVDNLRAGYEGDVELTPRIDKLIAGGYLLLLGHVTLPLTAASAPDPVDDPAAQAPAKPRKKAANARSESGS
jgi:hypothetical protein